MSAPDPQHRTRALVAVAAAAVLFGTSGVARGLGPDGLSSAFVASWRAAIGGIALVLVAAATRSLPRPGSASASASAWAVAGGVAVVGYQVAFFAAADRVGVGPAAVVTIGTGPVIAGALDAALGRRPTARWAVGVAVAVAGIVALSTGGTSGGHATGWLFAVLAGCCYPVYGLAAQRLMAVGAPALGAIATVFGAGAVMALPVAIATTTGTRTGTGSGVGAATVAPVATVAYLGLVATALAYAWWAIGLRHLTLSDTVAVTLAEPVAAVVLSALLLDEPLGVRSVVAMIVVVAGVAMATRPAQRTERLDRTEPT